METNNSIQPAIEKKPLNPAEKLKLQRAVKEFESVFVGYMLKSMRNTIEKADNPTEGFGADLMEGMFDAELAKHVSKSGNLGLADMLYQKLTGERLPKSQRSGEVPVPIKGVQTKDVIMTIGDVIAKKNEHSARAALLQPSGATTQPVATKTSASVPTVKVANSLKKRLEGYDEFIAKASEMHGVEQNLIKAVIAAESNAVASAKSPKNAKGLMQLIDSTATAMGVRNVWDPQQNIMGGTRYLKHLLETFDGDEVLALASYNAGPGNVQKYKGVPPFKETQAYVQRVKKFMELFSSGESTDE